MKREGTVTARRLIRSPIGTLLAEASDRGVTTLRPAGGISAAGPPVLPAEQTSEVLDRLEEELVSYFGRRLREFTVPLSFPETASPFSKRVWTETMTIPYGSRTSYSDLARAIGAPRAVRATARSLKSNPVLLLVPCHRVVSSKGGLGGFSAGIRRKEFLLRLEDPSFEPDLSKPGRPL